jgi:hypothetical protein
MHEPQKRFVEAQLDLLHFSADNHGGLRLTLTLSAPEKDCGADSSTPAIGVL